MAATNDLAFYDVCPKCGFCGEFLAETKFGDRLNLQYKVGDLVKWCESPSRQSLDTSWVRPKDGNTVLLKHGFAGCPSCETDFLVDVSINTDVVVMARLAEIVVYK